MDHIQRLAVDECVPRRTGQQFDAQPALPVQQSERQPLERRRERRRERQHVAVVAKPAETRDCDEPRAGERSEMHAVISVAREIAQIDERGLTEVFVREFEMADLGGDDCLYGSRQRRVSHRDGFIERKIALLLRRREGITAEVEREHQVGLLHHLARVQQVVRIVQEQRVAIWLVASKSQAR